MTGVRLSYQACRSDRYTLTATKPGYLPDAFGSSALGRQGTPISLSSSAVVTATITLIKGAALTGVVRDEHGTPIADVPIVVVEAARALLTPTRSIRETRSGRGNQFTDDRGVYRVYGLAPGEYFIAAIPPGHRTWAGSQLVRSEAEIDATLARLQGRRSPVADATGVHAPASAGSTTLAPVFYPATANVLEAARVKVGTAEERAGLDILLRPQTTRTLTGAVIAPAVAASAVLIEIRSGSQISAARWNHACPARGFATQSRRSVRHQRPRPWALHHLGQDETGTRDR